jgi:exopolysaccharide production protein ExoY
VRSAFPLTPGGGLKPTNVTPAAEQVFALKRAAKPQAHSLSAMYRIEPLIAGAALLAAAPMMLAVCATIVLLARRSPLVRHTRVGWRGQELPMLKLRTMWEPKQKWATILAIEDVSNPVPANKSGDDGRVTSKFAAWCRRYSIDEIPQLYHVFRGQMSLVGPRPITQAELEEHYGRAAEAVLSLRPGLTGLWQMRGRSRLTYAQRRRLDLWLAGHASPGLYLRILLRSIPVVLKGDDAY